MYAVVSPEKIEIPPGSVLKIPGTWSDYQTLSHQLGDRSIPRLKYRPGEIWLMSPLYACRFSQGDTRLCRQRV